MNALLLRLLDPSNTLVVVALVVVIVASLAYLVHDFRSAVRGRPRAYAFTPDRPTIDATSVTPRALQVTR